MRLIQSVFITLLIVALSFVTFMFGPQIEYLLLGPVLRANFTMVTEEGDRLRFFIEGTKLRGCQIESALFSWHFDHTGMPAAVSDESGKLRIPIAVVGSGQEFIAGAVLRNHSDGCAISTGGSPATAGTNLLLSLPLYVDDGVRN